MISIYKDFDNPPKDLLGDNPKITKAVKQALYDLYHGKCAYTEEKLDFEEMEVAQYRPKSLYPALEFEWSNLLPVSKKVNHLSSHQFPIEGKQVDKKLLLIAKNRKADSACLLAEKPLLLHPEVDTPENHFYFLDETLSSFTIRGKRTIEILQLNHDSFKLKRKVIADSMASLVEKMVLAVEEKYALNDYDSSRSEIWVDRNITHKYLETIEPFLNQLNSFSTLNKRFSYFVNCYIEKQVLGIKQTVSQVKSSSDAAKISADSRDIIELCVHHLLNKDSYLYKEDKTLHKLSFDDSKWVKALPYALQDIHIKKFHSINDLTINSIPLNTKWIFLTGENGQGKTLVLQSIALVLSGENKLSNDQIKIDATLYLGVIHRIRFPRHIDWQNPFDRPFFLPSGDTSELVSGSAHIRDFAAYGSNRLALSGHTDAGSRSPAKINKIDNLFSFNNALYSIEEYLTNIHNRPQFKSRYNAICSVLLELLPSVSRIIIDDTQEKKRVLYQEKTSDESLSSPISLDALSTGNRSILAMVGDMIIEFMLNKEVDNPSDLEGIVLIDEIDIHLHPNWQKKFVQTLTRLFPKIQFIASTHSPIPLLGAPKETVILNVEKPSSREGIKVRKLDIDVTTLTPNTILTSPIFGFEGLSSIESEDQPRIYTQESYDDVAFEKALKANLQKLADDDDLSKYIIEKK